MRIKLRIDTRTSKGLLATGSIIDLATGEACRLIGSGSAKPLPDALGKVKETMIRPIIKPKAGKTKSTHSKKRS